MATQYGAWTYQYDELGQLTNAVLVSTDTNIPNQNLNYTYDALGNRVRTVENSATTDYTANNLDQYTQVGAMTLKYDADGSLTQKVVGATTLLSVTNDFENQVIGYGSSNGTWRFDYDALGFPSVVWRNGALNYQIHDPYGFGQLAAVYDDSGSLLERQFNGLGIVGVLNGATASFLTFDGNGNVSETTSAGPSLTSSQAFRPFGYQIQTTNTIQRLHGFGGEFGVAQMGPLNFMRARFFDTILGRFTAADPVGIAGEDMNLYRFVVNDPNLYVDPVGLDVLNLDKISNLTDQGTKVLDTWNWFQRLRDKIGKAYYNVFSGHYKDLNDADQQIKSTVTEYWNSPYNPLGFPWYVPKPWESKDDSNQRGPNRGNPFRNPDGTPIPCLLCRSIQTAITAAGWIIDPNSLTGPGGYGPQNYVGADSLFSYRIDFEITNALNEPNFGPAQVVVVSDPLTNTLDWTTFQFTEIGFGDQLFAIPSGTQHYEQTAHVSNNGVNFDVQIEASLNPVTGVLTVSYQSIDPLTGLPPQGTNGIVGFLQPEDGTGRGMGHVSYTIRPKADLPTGTAIRNVATISYDPISGGPTYRTDLSVATDPNSESDTNKQALVTIDADPPTSTVASLPAEAPSVAFPVCWSGSDLGSGISGYDIYVRSNGGPWTLWLANTPANCDTFYGQNLVAYDFYSVAHDGSGNVEAAPSSPDASTVAPANSPPILEPLPTNYFVISVNETLSITNVASDPDVPAQQLTFSLDPGSPSGAGIGPTNGVFTWTPSCDQGSTTNTITVRVTDNGTPQKSASQSVTVVVLECVQASLGRTVVQVGQTSSVPVLLLSTVELTNLNFSVGYPMERLTNFYLVVDTQQVSAPFLTTSNAGRVDIQLTLPADQVLHGPTNVGELFFVARSNQSSAFVPLPITDIAGVKPDGSLVANVYGEPGRVVVVGDEPLLEALGGTNGNVTLILYGLPGLTHQLLTATNLPATSWIDEADIVPTNLSQVIEIGEPTNQMKFFRAKRP